LGLHYDEPFAIIGAPYYIAALAQHLQTTPLLFSISRHLSLYITSATIVTKTPELKTPAIQNYAYSANSKVSFSPSCREPILVSRARATPPSTPSSSSPVGPYVQFFNLHLQIRIEITAQLIPSFSAVIPSRWLNHFLSDRTSESHPDRHQWSKYNLLQRNR